MYFLLVDFLGIFNFFKILILYCRVFRRKGRMVIFVSEEMYYIF